MIEINLTQHIITTPGLYLMRWKSHTGLVRIVGRSGQAWRILAVKEGAESLFSHKDLPTDGSIPGDALFSEPLHITTG